MSQSNSAGVKRHTPDPTSYHTDLSGYGTTIPASTKEGGSMGFDPHKPGEVIVDPDMPDGNKVIDFGLFRENVQEFNNAVNSVGRKSNSDVSQSQQAFQAYVAASEKIKKKEEEMTTPVEEAKKAPLPLVKDAGATSDRAPLVNLSRPAPARESQAEVNAAMLGTLHQLAESVAALHANTTSPAASEKAVEEQVGVTTAQIAEEVEKENAPERLIAGFETLEMPFITGPLAMKPKKEVYFEMPNAGTMAARYHEIHDGGNCLALIYDTRYEDGIQFMPPTLGDTKIRITVPRENKVYVVSSLGIHFNCGVLDIVVMFKHDEESQEGENLL